MKKETEEKDLDEIKNAIAKNILFLRSSKGMTQTDLAEKLNYTDKAISKWERAESVPDISVLKNIADLFGVSVDWLISSEHNENEKNPNGKKKGKKKNKAPITWISVLLVWFIATLIFVFFMFLIPDMSEKWLPFVYALPVTMIVWLILNSIWFDRRKNYLIISLLMWSFLFSLWISLRCFGINGWILYVLGIPGQAIIFCWSRIRYSRSESCEK